MPKLIIPPTRTHAQLAAWVNANKLVLRGSLPGREVIAIVEPSTSSTDRKIGRLRWPGKGRKGTVLRIHLRSVALCADYQALYRHDTSETYRRHAEARAWVTDNLTYSENP